ncbi:hypothetical protein CM15mP37_11760 [bacterium]|nr:MAG: hypothetical protein CM15mP37_11760 [bacterium]
MSWKNEDVDSSRTSKPNLNVPPKKLAHLPLIHTFTRGRKNNLCPGSPTLVGGNGDFPLGKRKKAYFLCPNGTNDVELPNLDSDSVNIIIWSIQMGIQITPLEDGFFDWWVEAQDRANLIEFDTNSFGVDHPLPISAISR